MIKNSVFERELSAAMVEAACEAAADQDTLFEELLLEQQEQM